MFDATKMNNNSVNKMNLSDAEADAIIDAQIEAAMRADNRDAIDIAIDSEIERAAESAAINNALDIAIDNGNKLPPIESAKSIEEQVKENADIVEQAGEDVDAVVEMLKENAESDEDIQNLREIINNDTPEVENPIEEGTGVVNVDPETGVTSITPEEGIQEEVQTRPVYDKSLSELVDDYEATQLPVLDDELNKQFKDEMKLSDSDAAQLLSVIHRHSQGERFSRYNALPDSVKEIIKKSAGEIGATSQDQINFFTNAMLDQFIQDANFNKEIVDFEQAIQKELNIPSLVDMHAEYIRENMEAKLLERADKLIEDGKVEQGEALKRVSAAFTSAYTYDKVYEKLKTDRKVRSRLAKDVENYKKFCNDFVYKFSNTKFNIHDIAICLPILERAFPHRTRVELIMLVNTLWKSMESLDTMVLEDNIYAYYLIKNIMSLDYVDMNAKTEFTDLVMENIEKLIDTINDYVTAKAEYVAKVEAERKAKKGGKKHG